MRQIDLFAEDAGHEAVLLPLLKRVAEQYRVEIQVRAACRALATPRPIRVQGSPGTFVRSSGSEM